jgi:hypothetical protein
MSSLVLIEKPIFLYGIFGMPTNWVYTYFLVVGQFFNIFNMCMCRKECHCMLFLTSDNDFAGTDQVLVTST